jgi:hypothetical protein
LIVCNLRPGQLDIRVLAFKSDRSAGRIRTGNASDFVDIEAVVVVIVPRV